MVNKMIRTISISIFFIVILLLFLGIWIKNPANWEKVKAWSYLSSFQNKPEAELSIHERFALFQAHFTLGNISKAYHVAERILPNIDKLNKFERIYIATQLGRFLDADHKYDLEFEIYDKFLKDSDPEYYHIFRANLFKRRGDKVSARNEFLLAEQLAASSPELKKLIDAELVKSS